MLRDVAARLARSRASLNALLALSRPRRFLVLCYHRVNDGDHPYFGGIPKKLFRDQMTVLREHFSVHFLNDLVERAAANDVPRNAVAITFDDGYRDNYTEAFPILRELGLPATIFLVTEAVDANRLIWHDRMFDAFHRTEARRVRFDGSERSLSAPAERRESLNAILNALRTLSPDERDAKIDGLLEALGVSAPADGWDKLSWDQVREMSQNGIRFGAHTLDHPILSRVAPGEAERQVRDSKERIEREIGVSVDSFAYPNGRLVDFDETTQRILADEGFRCAVTTVPGANDANHGSFDPLALRRVGMWGDDPYLSAVRLARSRLA